MKYNLDMDQFDFQDIVGRAESTYYESQELGEFFKDKRILVTGAGGSIGSELVKQLNALRISQILATDRDENALHSLQLSIGGSALFNDARIRLLDVRDEVGVHALFEKFKPDIVIHAAALKHLSALEIQPREAFLTNTIGTWNVLSAAMHFNVERFINISTDKAADPTSVLGKSKMCAELLTGLANHRSDGGYSSVRFGNVFASRGSVIETFQFQIEKGLPLTLTDPNVTRYFMSAFEACSLVLHTALIDRFGIFVLDMGEPILLQSVIANMMQFMDKKSPVAITGLRPGEKLNEVLHTVKERMNLTSIKGVSIIEHEVFDIRFSEEFLTEPANDVEALVKFGDIMALFQRGDLDA